MSTIAGALIDQLKARGVEVVFGIPGVHTVELYRGLTKSGIRNVTPRHEQGAGFMADGYARVSGKPGVAFLITGPGLTNAITPMAQARADSIPMLVISSVNKTDSLGKGLGHLHELPDQLGLSRTVCELAFQVQNGEALDAALNAAFEYFETKRAGPVHIELPLDVAGLEYRAASNTSARDVPCTKPREIEAAAGMINAAHSPVIIAGGGAKNSGALLRQLAEKTGAPVIQTVNARGVLFDHALSVPASPSLQSVRDLCAQADCVLALGTELGPTDFDMYATGDMPKMAGLIRVDISDKSLGRHPADLPICSDVDAFLNALLPRVIEKPSTNGAALASQCRKETLEEIGAEMHRPVTLLDAIRDAVPNAIIVGDSTQLIYAGNLFYDHDRPAGWFNAATGYGALGYAIPAAIGAAFADPSAEVICLAGDGGAQFSLSELMAAKDEGVNVTFIIWNNYGYQEIETSMQAADVDVVGCDPTPPEFSQIAAACDLPFHRCADNPSDIAKAMGWARGIDGPLMIEVQLPKDG